MKKPAKFGKYLLLERINIGGMAEVFKAKSFGVEGFEKMLAIKRILPNIAEDEEFITMFIDEAKIAVQLNHANIAQIYDLGKIEDSYFIALEFIHGKDLRTIWDRHKKRGLLLPIPMSVYIMSRCCEGLDYAHRKKDASGRDLNIVHRDVSPQNVLISYEGEVKVIDFGIAKAANKASKTQAGILKGKFGYMSPEQVRGLPLDRRSDIFSTGIILYELLTGERLFVGESDFSTLEKVRNVEILPPSTYNRKIPDALEKIVLRALSKDPDDRYQSAYDMQEELQRFLILNKTNFARKDLANYMKRAFKADIDRALQRQASYQNITPDDIDEDMTGSGQTAPGMPPGLAGKPPAPKAPSSPPRPVQPKATPAPPPIAPKPPAQVFVGDDDDDDDDIETVVFDPRAGPADSGVAALIASQQSSSAPPPRAPVPPPLAAPPFVESDPLDDSADITAPGGLQRPMPTNLPTDDYDVVSEVFPTGESTAAHELPAIKQRSRLNIIIAALAVVAVIVVGLAVFKFLQQQGVFGGGATVKIQVKPPDAKIYLDDKLVGDFSPTILQEVDPGTHVIVTKRENYTDHQEKIEVPAGELHTVNIEMAYIPATLELTVQPEDATVKMDGQEIGRASPIRMEGILPGEAHAFKIERTGYKTLDFSWAFKPQQTRTEKVTLEERFFELDIQSEPSGAWVYLDEEKKGRTPQQVKGLRASKSYKLRLKHAGFPDWESTIRYVEGEEVRQLRIRLEASVEGAAPQPKEGTEPVTVAKVEPKPAPKPAPKPRTKPRPKPKSHPKSKGTGLLKLNSTPWGKVWIDGRDINASTPLINHPLPAGRHKITIHFNTGESKTVPVEIKPDETTKLIVHK